MSFVSVDAIRKSVIGKAPLLGENRKLDEEEELENSDAKNYLRMISYEYSMLLKITDRIGFRALPNHEVCIAGLKLAGQFMPHGLDAKLSFKVGVTWDHKFCLF